MNTDPVVGIESLNDAWGAVGRVLAGDRCRDSDRGIVDFNL